MEVKFYRFNLANLFYTLLVIVWGAYVRASGSGAGCGAHWPLCNGEVIPVSDSIKMMVEFSHRASSGISLTLVAIGFIWAVKTGKKNSRVRRAAGFAVIAIILEALLGAALVLFKLVEFDQSAARAISIALHLINTLFLVGSLTTLAFVSREKKNYEASVTPRLLPQNRLFLSVATVFVLLGVSGAITALGDTLFPSTALLSGMKEDFSSTAHFLVKLRVIHPFLATLWVILVFLWSKSLEITALHKVRAYLLTFVVLQFLLGFLNWMMLAPTSLQLIHLLVADAVFISLWLSGLMHAENERAS